MDFICTHVLSRNYFRSFNPRLRLLFLFFNLYFLLVVAKASSLSDTDYVKAPAIIATLEECNLPPEIITRIRRMSPEQIQNWHEEFQQTSVNEKGEGVLVVVMLRFNNDHLSGFINEVALNNTSEVLYNKKINIPVEWMCISPNPDHPIHYINSIAEIKPIGEMNHCQSWVQKDSDMKIYLKDRNQKKRKFFLIQTAKVQV